MMAAIPPKPPTSTMAAEDERPCPDITETLSSDMLSMIVDRLRVPYCIRMTSTSKKIRLMLMASPPELILHNYSCDEHPVTASELGQVVSSNLWRIRELTIDVQHLESLEAVTTGLANLTYLHATRCHALQDLSALSKSSIKHLRLKQCKLSVISKTTTPLPLISRLCMELSADDYYRYENAFHRDVFPSLRALELHGYNDRSAPPGLANLPSLNSIRIAGSSGFRPATLAVCHELSRLCIRGCDAVVDLGELDKFSASLVELHINCDSFDILVHEEMLSQCKKLTHLHIPVNDQIPSLSRSIQSLVLEHAFRISTLSSVSSYLHLSELTLLGCGPRLLDFSPIGHLPALTRLKIVFEERSLESLSNGDQAMVGEETAMLLLSPVDLSLPINTAPLRYLALSSKTAVEDSAFPTPILLSSLRTFVHLEALRLRNVVIADATSSWHDKISSLAETRIDGVEYQTGFANHGRMPR